MDEAFKRYKGMISRMLGHKKTNTYEDIDEEPTLKILQNNSHLKEISINLQGECEEKPHPAMVEECKPQLLISHRVNLSLFTFKFLIDLQTN